MTTLTDRYLFAAARTLPAAQRDELSRDLAERIADTIEARIESGASTPETAERDALVELGNPGVLAADYSDRPLMLIGPRYFLIWRRLLLFLESFIPGIAAGASALGMLLAGGGWEVLGAAIGIGITVAVHLAFWVTLVFALIDRYDPARAGNSAGAATGSATTRAAGAATGAAAGRPDDALGWTPEQLPQLPDARRRSRAGDLVATLVWLAIAAGLLVWQQFGIVWFDGERQPIPLLDPALWSFWLPYLLVLIALEAALAVWVYRAGWSWGRALINALLAVAFAVPVVWLFVEGRLFSSEFIAAVEPNLDADATWVLSVLFVVAVIGFALWDCIDGVVKTARTPRPSRSAA